MEKHIVKTPIYPSLLQRPIDLNFYDQLCVLTNWIHYSCPHSLASNHQWHVDQPTIRASLCFRLQQSIWYSLTLNSAWETCKTYSMKLIIGWRTSSTTTPTARIVEEKSHPSSELLQASFIDQQGPDNYVVQNACFCLSKMQYFVCIFPGLRLYCKTEILLLFQYLLVLC